MLGPDGKVVDLAPSERGKAAEPSGKPLKLTEAKLAPMYSCHGADDFGTIHWTLDQLLHGSNEVGTIWNPMDVVRGCDPAAFLNKLADVGIKGPPVSGGSDDDNEVNTAAHSRLKQSEQYWKNKATALEKKMQHGGYL